MSRPVRDILGQRFGMLVVVERAEAVGTNAHWRCKCDCGGSSVVLSQSLTRGLTKSCGCLRRMHRPFRAASNGMTAAEKAEARKDRRRKKREAVAAGKPLSAGENAALARVLRSIARAPMAVAEICAELELGRSTAQNYVQLLLARREVELACIREDKSKVYRVAGSDAVASRGGADPERFDGAELAAALGYDMVPMPVGGRVYRIDDDREAA